MKKTLLSLTLIFSIFFSGFAPGFENKAAAAGTVSDWEDIGQSYCKRMANPFR